MAEALAKLEFQVVLKKNVGLGELVTALRDLSREAKDADVAMVFFAGNGVEVDGRAYLIPADARLTSAGDLDKEAISLKSVLDRVADAHLGLIIVDACRDDPFRSGRLSVGTRGLHRGMAGAVNRPITPANLMRVGSHRSFLIFSGEPGKVVADGAGRNSPFTAALIKHIATPGQELRHLFVRVRADVIAATLDAQVPTHHDDFNGELVLKSP